MAALTSEQLLALKTTLVARFNAGLISQRGDWKKVAKVIPSSSASNTFAWLSQFPAFREWVGSRLHKALSEKAYTVVNKKFENTIDILRTEIEDDAFGHYGAVAESYGEAIDDLFNDLIFQALASGFASECYDGQYFFDTDHPIYPNEDGTGTATTISNVIAGAGEPWVLLCTERAPKAIYLQERVKPEFYSLTSLDNPNVFDYDRYSFGGRWRGNSAYGFWQLAFGAKAALTEDNFNTAYDAMMKFKGDGNRKLGITPDLLVVGPNNRAAAEKLILAQNKTGGESNTNYKKVELLVSPWMAL
jgi:phage major head subunit gpT-like protein